MMNPNKSIDRTLECYGEAKARRTKYNSIMEEAGQYCWPAAQDMVHNAEHTEGLQRTVDLYDSTALMAAYRMTSGIFTYLMPVGAKWFEFVAQDYETNNNSVMKEWLSIAGELAHKEIWRSNFQREMFITIRSMIVFGTGVISVELIDGELVFKSHHIGYMFFDENSKGEIDTAYRQIFYTARQAMQEFGRDSNLGKSLDKAIKSKKLNEKFEFVHVCAPNKDFDSSKLGADKKKVKSVYINVTDKHEVKTGGFDDLPYVVARFSKVPHEIMGRGPAIEILPEIKMLNRMKKTFLEAAEKSCNPPVIAEDDGVVGQPVTEANGMIYIRSGAMKPEALKTGINTQLNAEVIAQQQEVVREGFFYNDFQALANHRNMSATEAVERVEESIVHIAPQIVSHNKETNSPIISRSLNLLIEAKKIPPPPIEFDADIVYQGRLALAMSNVQTNAIEATLAKWAPYEERMNVFANVNGHKAFRTSWLNAGAPADSLRPEDEVLAEEQEIAALQKASAEAEIGANASKAFKNVNQGIEANSLAEQLV